MLSIVFLFGFLLSGISFLQANGISFSPFTSLFILELFGFSTHIGQSAETRILFAFFLFTYVQGRVFRKINREIRRKNPRRGMNHFYTQGKNTFVFAIFIGLSMIFLPFFLFHGRGTFSNNTKIMIIYAIGCFSLVSFTDFIAYAKLRRLDMEEDRRYRLLSFSTGSLIFLSILPLIYSSSATNYNDYMLFEVLLIIVFTSLFGSFLRKREKNADPLFIIRSTGPTLGFLFLSYVFVEGTLTTMISEFLILSMVIFYACLSTLISYYASSLKRRGSFPALALFLLTVFYLIMGPMTYLASNSTINLRILFDLTIEDQLILTLGPSSLFLQEILLIFPVIYVTARGLHSGISNEVKGFFMAIILSFLSFSVIFYVIFTNYDLTLLLYSLFFKYLFLKFTLGNILPIIFVVAVLVILGAVSSILLTFASPGTKKTGMLASFFLIWIDLFSVLNIESSFNIIQFGGAVQYILGILMIAIPFSIGSIMTSNFREVKMNEKGTTAYSLYVQDMIKRGSDVNGVEFGVNVSSFNSIEFIGPASSGKTTFLSCLLNFMDQITSESNYHWDITNGIEKMESLLNYMIIENTFPPKTKSGKGQSISFTIESQNTRNKTSVSIIDWSGKLLESVKNFKKLDLSNGKAFAFFVDQSMLSDLTEYDEKCLEILRKVLESRSSQIPLPKVAFVLFNYPESYIEGSGSSPKSIIMQLEKTWEFVSKNLIEGCIFLRAKIKTVKNNDGNIVPFREEVEGIWRIQYSQDINEGFRLFFGWLLAM